MTSKTRFVVMSLSVPVIAFAIVGGLLGRVTSGEGTYQHLKVFDLSNPAAPDYIMDYGFPGQNPGSTFKIPGTTVVPPGTIVRVSNGETGRVVALNRHHPLRPRLELVARGSSPPRLVDLVEMPFLYIIGPVAK